MSLDTATGRDQAYIDFLQRAGGYSMTGDPSEECLFFLHGLSKSGKTTFLEALKAAFGDYAMTTDFETWLARREPGAPRPDLARLAGARLVTSAEVSEGKKLAESLVKQSTGGDTVTVRFLFAREFEYKPAYTLWLAANHSPQISDDDDAIWNRIHRLPFDHPIPKESRDPNVKSVLRDPQRGGPAILAWLVQGCLGWQKSGLGVPPVVESATRRLREDMDPLKDFIWDSCVLDPQAVVSTSVLRKAYEDWAHDSGVKDLVHGKAWGERLRGRGCSPGKGGKGARFWTGIRLLNPDESPSDSSASSAMADRVASGGLFGEIDKVFQTHPHEETLSTMPSRSATPPPDETDYEVF